MILPLIVWRPLEFLAEGTEESAERETVIKKFKVKDVEFEEDRVVVV